MDDWDYEHPLRFGPVHKREKTIVLFGYVIHIKLYWQRKHR